MGTSNKIIKCIVCNENKKHEAKGMCKQCYNQSQRNKHKEEYNEYGKQYRIDNKEKLADYKREYIHGDTRERYLSLKRANYKKNKKMAYMNNTACSLFLGVHVAERVLSHVFKQVKRMPNGNVGYDFTCARGRKIDVKSACVTSKRGNSHRLLDVPHQKKHNGEPLPVHSIRQHKRFKTVTHLDNTEHCSITPNRSKHNRIYNSEVVTI